MKATAKGCISEATVDPHERKQDRFGVGFLCDLHITISLPPPSRPRSTFSIYYLDG